LQDKIACGITVSEQLAVDYVLLVMRMMPLTSHLLPVTHRSAHSGDGVLFLMDFFVYIFISLFVSLLARLRENGWTDLHEIFREGAE